MKSLKLTRPLALALLLYFLNLMVNLLFVHMVNREGVLSGEEASVAIRDVFLFSHRLQHNPVATNWGAHLFYWTLHHLLDGYGLFYGRIAKALQMALIAPLFFGVQVRLLKIPKIPAFFLAWLTMLLPGIVNYSWMCTEFGMETTLGLLAILIATSNLAFAGVLSTALAAFSALTYGAGLAFTPVVFYLLWQKRVKGWPHKKDWLYFGGLALVFGAVLILPFLWWKNPARILLGGGQIPTFYGGLLNIKQFLKETWFRGGSYYYFSKYPAYSSLLLAIPVLGGMSVSIRQRKGAWIWLGFLGALALYALAGREPGMRRGVAMVIFLSFFLSMGIAPWWDAEKSRWKKTCAGVLVTFSILFSTVQYSKVLKRFSTGMELWTDYDFVILPESTMVKTCETLLENPSLLQGKHWDPNLNMTIRDYEPDRVMPILYFLQKSQVNKSGVLLTEKEVLEKIKISRPVVRGS